MPPVLALAVLLQLNTYKVMLAAFPSPEPAAATHMQHILTALPAAVSGLHCCCCCCCFVGAVERLQGEGDAC
jgi:hypothetical protein